MPGTHPQLTENAKSDLAAIKKHFSFLRSLPPQYDFPAAVMISHAEQHAAESADRLRYYAGQVVGSRMMQFGYLNAYKAIYLTDSFFAGKDAKNPYQIAMSARSLMEIAATALDVRNIIKANSGDHPEQLLERVKIIDDALIQATYGHRVGIVKEFFNKTPLSKLRPVDSKDEKTLTARNALTRVAKWQSSGSYPECQEDYDSLSEFMHPNAWQNTILMAPSPYGEKMARISRFSPDAATWVLGRALRPVKMSLAVIESSINDAIFPFKCEILNPLPGMAQFRPT